MTRIFLPVPTFVFLTLLTSIPSASRAAPPAATEYQIKAVFLFNFSQFVEWPAEAFAGPEAPFGICVLGRDPFGVDLDEVVRGESARGRPLTVFRFPTARALAQRGGNACQIVFVAADAAGRQANLVAALPQRAILTVSDSDGVASDAMVRFVLEKNRVRLRINGEQARAAGLTVSSKLLRLGS